jgi:hypothetical protein
MLPGKRISEFKSFKTVLADKLMILKEDPCQSGKLLLG